MLFLDANGLVNITISDVLTLGASCVTIFITVWASNRIMRHKMRTENETKFGKKANKIDLTKLETSVDANITKLEDYVDQQDRGLHKRVNKLEQSDVDLVKKIDDNHKFLITLITDSNRDILNALSNKK